MIGAPRCGYVKTVPVVEYPIVEQVLTGVEAVCDATVRTLFSIPTIADPVTDAALGIGGNK